MEGINWVLKVVIIDRGSWELYNFVFNIIFYLKNKVVLCYLVEFFGNLWLWVD